MGLLSEIVDQFCHTLVSLEVTEYEEAEDIYWMLLVMLKLRGK